MAQPPTQIPGWVWNPARQRYDYLIYWNSTWQQWYGYDGYADQFVYQNGSCVPRPDTIPRLPFDRANSQAPPPPEQVSTSPTRESEYIWGSSGPSNPPPQRVQWAPSTAYNPAAHMATLSLQDRNPAPTVAQTPPVRRYDYKGMRVAHSFNPSTQVASLVATEPVDRITDPVLYDRGVRAHRMLLGTSNEREERLYSTFKLRDSPDRFFQPGRVFLVLWAEPAGESKTVITQREQNDRFPSVPGMTMGNYGQQVFSKVRRFVVIRAAKGFCSALPIATYGGQGVGKLRSLEKSDHTIIYTGDTPPAAMPSEAPHRGEQGMQPTPIRVTPDNPVDKLDPLSRLDFGKVHTIQHNIKVRQLGMVHPNSMHALLQQFQRVWNLPTAPSPAAGLSSSRVPKDDEDEGEGEDEETQDRGDDSDHEEDAPAFASPRTVPAAIVSPRVTTAARPQDRQAQIMLSSFNTLLRQGRPPIEALEMLVAGFVQTHRDYSSERARALIRDQLRHANQSVQSASSVNQTVVSRGAVVAVRPVSNPNGVEDGDDDEADEEERQDGDEDEDEDEDEDGDNEDGGEDDDDDDADDDDDEEEEEEDDNDDNQADRQT